MYKSLSDTVFYGCVGSKAKPITDCAQSSHDMDTGLAHIRAPQGKNSRVEVLLRLVWHPCISYRHDSFSTCSFRSAGTKLRIQLVALHAAFILLSVTYCLPSALSLSQDKLQIKANLEQEARRAQVLSLWLDGDREGENISFEVGWEWTA